MAYQSAPLVADSAREERAAFVRDKYACISNCDLCGNCALLHGKDAETAHADYIGGYGEYCDTLLSYRY